MTECHELFVQKKHLEQTSDLTFVERQNRVEGVRGCKGEDALPNVT